MFIIISELNYVLIFMLILLFNRTSSFDDEDDEHFRDAHQIHHDEQQAGKPMPKDKVLLRDIKTLLFERNKRTTSKRTHSIPQLSCVGGTAGCKLFTPDVVECENIAGAGEKHSINKVNWRCRADMSERVAFNHVEVICEGYDYPEDDYILLGSCGLEFTLDYTNLHDYHEKSYFEHMDEHEKKLHNERVRKKLTNDQRASSVSVSIANLSEFVVAKMFIIVIVVMTLAGSILLVIHCLPNRASETHSNLDIKSTRKPIRGYGPLTSAVMTTKKAC